MKIAVTYENGQVFQHFGHTEQFKVYSVEEGKVVGDEILSASGNGHGALAGLLSSWGVSRLICGGIGAGAKSALAQAGIKLYPGVSGDVDEQLQAFLRGELVFNLAAECGSHGQQHHGNSCGDHTEKCGHHRCQH